MHSPIEKDNLAPLERLPEELHQMILSTLTDAHSLKSAILSSRSLHKSFRAAEQQVCYNFLSAAAGINRDLIHEAISTRVSANITGSGEDVRDFVRGYTNKRPLVPNFASTISLVAPLKQLQISIDFFTEGFLNHTLNFQDIYGSGDKLREDLSFSPPSHLERRRIRRSFYLFEIYRNIFGHPSNPFVRSTDMENWEYSPAEFFSNFAPWELERLACINDYFMEKMANGMFTCLLPSINTPALLLTLLIS